ncbi:unnamed protein product [Phytomonas sp. EM1]|nr:unnamed protein product [Phytomonas sp. EM1]|eukprot:CCW62631.1 unnamed protein product [Phytomonas sp. isolate EM1]
MSKFQVIPPFFPKTRSSSEAVRSSNVHEVQHGGNSMDEHSAHGATPLGDRLAGRSVATEQPPSSTPPNLVSPFKDISFANHGTPRTEGSFNVSLQSLPPGVEIRPEDELRLREQIERLQREVLRARTTIADYKDNQSNLQSRLNASETERRTTVLELQEISQQFRAFRRSVEEQRRAHEREKLEFIEVKSQRDDLLEKMQDAWDRIAAFSLEQKKSEAEKVLLHETVWREFGLSEQQAVALRQHLQSLNSRTLELTHEKQETNDRYIRLLHCIGDTVRELNTTLKGRIHESFERIRSLQSINATSNSEVRSGKYLLDQTSSELERSWEDGFDGIFQSDAPGTDDMVNDVASPREVVQQLLTPLLQSLRGIGSIWQHLFHAQQAALMELNDACEARSTLLNDLTSLRQAHEQLLAKSAREQEEVHVGNVESVHGLRALARQLRCDANWAAVQSCVMRLQQRCQGAPASTKMGEDDQVFKSMQSSYKAASMTSDTVRRWPNENTRCLDTLSEGIDRSEKHDSSVESRQHTRSEVTFQAKSAPIPEMKPCYQTASPAHHPPHGLRHIGALTRSQTLPGMLSTPKRGQDELASITGVTNAELEKRVGVRNDLLFFFAAACCDLISDLAAVIKQRYILCRHLWWATGTGITSVCYPSGASLSMRARRRSLRVLVLAVMAVHRLCDAVSNRREEGIRFIKRRWWGDRLRKELSSENRLLHSRCSIDAVGGRAGVEVWPETVCQLLDSEGDGTAAAMERDGELISIMETLLEAAETVGAFYPSGYLGHDLLPSPIRRTTPSPCSRKHALAPRAIHCRLFDHDEKPYLTTHDAGLEVTRPPLSLAGGNAKHTFRNGEPIRRDENSFTVAHASGLHLQSDPHPARAMRTEVDISLLSSIRGGQRGGGTGSTAAINEPNGQSSSVFGLAVDVAYPAPVLKPSQASSEEDKGFGGRSGLEGRNVEDTLKLSIQQDYFERAYRGAAPRVHSSSLHEDSARDEITNTGNYSSKVHVSFPSDTFATEVMGMIEALDRCVTGALRRGEGGIESARESIE